MGFGLIRKIWIILMRGKCEECVRMRDETFKLRRLIGRHRYGLAVQPSTYRERELSKAENALARLRQERRNHLRNDH